MDKNEEDIVEKIDAIISQHLCAQKQEQRIYLQSLPHQFIQFLKQKNVEVNQLAIPLPRYIRLKPGFQPSLEQIIQSLHIKQSQIVRIDNQFYALDPSVKINSCEFYQNGYLYGMDFSSCIPARCLQAEEGNTILQLCSAPGNKSMYIADSLKQVKIIGVEININRANVMKNLVKKYNLDDRITVVVEDGVKYQGQNQFDRVLIDAECTHEGSVKHLKKFKEKQKLKKNDIKGLKNISKQQQKQFKVNNSNTYTSEINKANEWSFQDFKQRFLDEKKLQNLSSLQLGLLENGFKQLKTEGILVYSTCSFDKQQNEDIVELFLERNSCAKLLDCSQGLNCKIKYEESNLKGCIKFKPSISRCGGMFVCKLKKMMSKQHNEIQQKSQQPLVKTND